MTNSASWPHAASSQNARRALPDDGDHEWFCQSRGEIMVKNPAVEILRKMHSIAQALGATTVQGDDGELYDSQGKP